MNGRLAYSDLGDMNFRFGHAGLGAVLVAREVTRDLYWNLWEMYSFWMCCAAQRESI